MMLAMQVGIRVPHGYTSCYLYDTMSWLLVHWAGSPTATLRLTRFRLRRTNVVLMIVQPAWIAL